MLTAAQTDFLVGARVARLATVDAQQRPHVLPICYALVDGVLYTPLDEKPKRVPVERLARVRDIIHNPSVCLLVDEYDEDWTRLRWLQVRGTAAMVQAGAMQARAVAALRERYPQYRAMALEEAPVIGITPTRVVEWAWRHRVG